MIKIKNPVSDIMHQIRSIRYKVSNIKYQISSFRYNVSDIKYQISDIVYQISNIWQYLTISQPMCWIYQYIAILKLFHYASFFFLFLTWASPRGAFAPKNWQYGGFLSNTWEKLLKGKNIGKYYTILGITNWYWALVHNIVPWWTILGNTVEYWTLLHSILQYLVFLTIS